MVNCAFYSLDIGLDGGKKKYKIPVNLYKRRDYFLVSGYLSKSFLIGSKSPLLYSAWASSSQVGIAFRSASADKTGGSVDALETSTFTVNLFQTPAFLTYSDNTPALCASQIYYYKGDWHPPSPPRTVCIITSRKDY